MSTTGPLLEKSNAYALAVVLFCKRLMEEKKEFVLSKQLMKSGSSVGANVEEAQFAQSRNDFISKLSIALKEASESKFWLRLIRDAHFATAEETAPLLEQAEEIVALLVRSIKTSKSRL